MFNSRPMNWDAVAKYGFRSIIKLIGICNKCMEILKYSVTKGQKGTARLHKMQEKDRKMEELDKREICNKVACETLTTLGIVHLCSGPMLFSHFPCRGHGLLSSVLSYILISYPHIFMQSRSAICLYYRFYCIVIIVTIYLFLYP